MNALPELLDEIERLAERVRVLETFVDKLQAAISWIEPPFVNAETDADELRTRVEFVVADARRARQALTGATDDR